MKVQERSSLFFVATGRHAGRLDPHFYVAHPTVIRTIE